MTQDANQSFPSTSSPQPHKLDSKPATGTMPTSSITTLLVDDHLLFRESLCSILAGIPNIEIVGATGDGRESLRLIDRHHPRVVILDISM
ncbi:MAG: response regulator transcription factor, partial [Desulfobulbaceae bacterium]|nr:response regulator transcription factor [Desulfobulbaceae bacterium]